MSMRTKIHGLTAWVNFRLMPYKQLLSNVIMDLLTGTSMKFLIESMTGTSIKKLDSMDGLSPQQIQTQVNRVIEELKKCDILPQDVYIDARLFAMRDADHLFDLLWRLICHDIWFLWERYEYLQHDDPKIITQVSFKWTPDPPPNTKTKQTKKSLLTGFDAYAHIIDEINKEKNAWIKFPNCEFMKKFKQKTATKEKYPAPEACILEIVNSQLKKTSEDQKLICPSLDDLADSQILCALLNSFVPNTFIHQLFLNDRWTINLVLKTAEKMFFNETPFDSEDLFEADNMAVTSYFTFFLMVAFKYRQCHIVALQMEKLEKITKELNQELAKCPFISSNALELQERKNLRSQIENCKKEMSDISDRFDIRYCQHWVKHVANIQDEAKTAVERFMKQKFDCVTAPRNITINDLCLSHVINLSLTNGIGFYLSEESETISEGRRLILKSKKTGEFLDDKELKSKTHIQKLLGINCAQPVLINPKDHPEYEFYFEALSKNKCLKAGNVFLYQVFPGNFSTWHRKLIKSIKLNEMDSVSSMVAFFSHNPSFINSKTSRTGSTALHVAAKLGRFEIVQLLLENGADVNAKDKFHCTPLFSAIEGSHRQVAHLFIEWGCEVHIKNLKGLTPFDSAKSIEFQIYLADLYEHYSSIVPKLLKGNEELISTVIQDHVTGRKMFGSLRSRCINGSTLLHTASHYGLLSIIQQLLALGVDINLRDHKGATPLHRSKNCETMKLLLDKGADVDFVDLEGNTCLHICCYGKANLPTKMECLQLLLQMNASTVKRNNKNLLPIHCCVMQGCTDAIELLLKHDSKESILKILNEEVYQNLPSLPLLALANNFVHCSQWLLEKGFSFKENEPDKMLAKILTGKFMIEPQIAAVKVLLETGADPNVMYSNGNTPLHYAAQSAGHTDTLELLLTCGAAVDKPSRDSLSPLMVACKSNNIIGAVILLRHKATIQNASLHAFDFIPDLDDWINSGYFSGDVLGQLKSHSLRHSRDLIYSISQRVKSASLARVSVPQGFRESLSAPQHSYRSLMSAPASCFSHRHIKSTHRSQSAKTMSSPMSGCSWHLGLPL